MTSVERIKRVMADVFDLPPDSIGDDASVTTLPQWESMQALTLLMCLEEEFDVHFTDDEAMRMNSLDAIRQELDLKGVA